MYDRFQESVLHFHDIGEAKNTSSAFVMSLKLKMKLLNKTRMLQIVFMSFRNISQCSLNFNFS